MALAAGTRLGAYEIIAVIGVGGMGEVYRARDTRLGRDVAVKVLPSDVAADSDRLSRFEREAQVLASLNHPNIASIHGIEDSTGSPALVMELVAGPTLADCIAKGPIPFDEVLPIAKQIAEALEAAHDLGIVHRDLKPANIKLRPDGTVKVLDFGLAKANEPAIAASAGASRSPTITSPARTEPGIILGTAAYMSPEQARGRPLDKRADIWAFGCVLYETLTGRRAFEGEDVPLTLSSVLQREPDWDALPKDVPALLVSFLRRCLAKDPRQRVRDMGDIRLALEGLFEPAATPGQALSAPSNVVPASRWASVPAMMLGAAAVTALTTWSVTRPAPALPAPVIRTSLVLPPTHVRTHGYGRRGIAISPTGTHVVYVANDQLYVRALAELEARPLAGTQDHLPGSPFFSPEGEWVGFYSTRDRALEKVSLAGGSPVTLAPATNPYGATWEDDDSIVYGQAGQGIVRVSATGGEPKVLVPVDAPAQVHQPQLILGGQAVLFTRCASAGCSTPSSWDAADVVMKELATGEQTVLVKGGTDARYLSTGHLLYVKSNTLLAVPIDLARRAVTAGPVPLVQGVSRAGIAGAANADVSRTGTLVYLGGEADLAGRLVWVDRAGREEVIHAPSRPYYGPRLSPDGARLIVFANDAERDLWVWDFARPNFMRLTDTPATETSGLWTPDGQRVVFNSDREGTRAIYSRPANGTGAVELLLKGPSALWPMSISPDGARLVYGQGTGSPGIPTDLYVLRLGTERRTEPLIVTEFTEADAEISPDGRWLAYRSNSSSRDEVYVQPFPDVDRGRWQISTGGGAEPLWSADGRDLFYRTEAAVMRVPIETTKGFAAGTPSLVLAGRYLLAGGRRYDVSRDGKRFLMVKAVPQTDPDNGVAGLTQIFVVQHWFDELKAHVPVR